MKWEKDAVGLLSRLRSVWEGQVEPEAVFANRGFLSAFVRIMVQYLKDLGYSAPEEELKNCLTLHRLTFVVRHGLEPTFTSQAKEAEWVAEAVALHTSKPELVKSELMEMIIQLATYIEDIIQTYPRLPSDYLRPIEDMVEGIKRYLVL